MSKNNVLDNVWFWCAMLCVVIVFISLIVNVFGYIVDSVGLASFKGTAIKTEGIIVQLGSHEYNYEQTNHYVYTEFTVNERIFRGKISNPYPRLKIGQRVTVYYYSDDPWDFRVKRGFPYASLLAVIFFCFLIYLFIYKRQRVMMIIKSGIRVINKKGWLLENGKQVMAQIINVNWGDHTGYYTYNNQTVYSDKRYVSITCLWKDETTGDTFNFYCNSIQNPKEQREDVQQLPVYFDENEPQRHYIDVYPLFMPPSYLEWAKNE